MQNNCFNEIFQFVAAVVRNKRSTFSDVTYFKIDHPFICLLLTKNQIIFMGKNVHPDRLLLAIHEEL